MERFTARQLRALVEYRSGMCVSMFMPTHPGSRDIREDPIRCKNLLDWAEERLRAMGMRGPDARAVLEPGWQLQVDAEFWSRQQDGLAMYAAPEFFRWWQLPLRLDEQLVVNERFYVKPLLPLLQDDGRFYVLAISQKQVRLFEGSHYSVAEMTPDTLPKNLREALNIDEYVDSMQYHSANPTQRGDARGRRPVMFFGHGGGGMDDIKAHEIQEYMLRVNNGLQEFFHDDRTPLVFAGVDYLFPLFRETCKYRYLMPEPVCGCPDLLNPRVLHDKAWQFVEPHFRERRQMALSRFENTAGTNLVARDLSEVIKGSWMGAIDALFVAKGAKLRGWVDQYCGDVAWASESGKDGEDLVEYAVAHTLMGNGSVFLLPLAEVPTKASLAATLRFPIPAPQVATQA